MQKKTVLRSRALVVVTSILFGAYHWWTGIGNIIEAALIGVLLMLFYRRQRDQDLSAPATV